MPRHTFVIDYTNAYRYIYTRFVLRNCHLKIFHFQANSKHLDFSWHTIFIIFFKGPFTNQNKVRFYHILPSSNLLGPLSGDINVLFLVHLINKMLQNWSNLWRIISVFVFFPQISKDSWKEKNIFFEKFSNKPPLSVNCAGYWRVEAKCFEICVN